MALPLAELHLHLEGTLEPPMIFELAARNGVELPYADLADLQSRYAFTDLQSFLDLYYINMQVLRTEQDFADLTRAYLARAAVAGVRHVEAFFDLQAHTGRGVPAPVALDGVTAALSASEREFGISSGLIVTVLRHLSGEDALTAYREVVDWGGPVLGIGLCSTEVGNPASKFAAVFAAARSDGLHVVAHAGEEGEPSYVWDVLDELHVERVDHGIRSVEDPRLLARLADERIPLTVCPLSNVRLRAVDRLIDHPLPRLLEHDVLVSINSDDPAYFGGYVDDNLAAVVETFGFGPPEQAHLAAMSIESSFLPADRKRVLTGEVTDWLAASTAPTAELAPTAEPGR